MRIWIAGRRPAKIAIAGAIYFREPVLAALIAGVALTAIGLSVMSTVPSRAVPPEPN